MTVLAGRGCQAEKRGTPTFSVSIRVQFAGIIAFFAGSSFRLGLGSALQLFAESMQHIQQ